MKFGEFRESYALTFNHLRPWIGFDRQKLGKKYNLISVTGVYKPENTEFTNYLT